MKFRKKPVVIDAVQWWPGIEHEFAGDAIRMGPSKDSWLLKTLENPKGFELTPGDWIICGIKGEFYACKPDIFAATYEPADV